MKLTGSQIEQLKLDIQSVATDWDSRGGYWKQKANKLTSVLTGLRLLKKAKDKDA